MKAMLVSPQIMDMISNAADAEDRCFHFVRLVSAPKLVEFKRMPQLVGVAEEFKSWLTAS